MFGFGILSCLTFLPLVGVAFILCLRGDDEATLRNAKYAALATTLVNMLLAFYAWGQYDAGTRPSSSSSSAAGSAPARSTSSASTACRSPSSC